MTAIITISSPVIIEQLAVCASNRQATWEEYIHFVEDPQREPERVFFNCGAMWIEDMGNEGINHSRFNKLFTMIFCFWKTRSRRCQI